MVGASRDTVTTNSTLQVAEKMEKQILRCAQDDSKKADPSLRSG
jgi:hypothetical protein